MYLFFDLRKSCFRRTSLLPGVNVELTAASLASEHRSPVS